MSRFGPSWVAAVALTLVTACDPVSAPLVRHQAGFQPTEDGNLQIWPGQDCPGVRKVTVEIEAAEGEPRDSWVLRSTQRSGATFTGLTLDEVPDGFETSRSWPDDPVWNTAKTVWIKAETAGGQTSSYVSVDSMVEDADDHPGEYYVEDLGWLTQDDFRTETDEDEGIAPLCGPGTPAA